MQRKGSFSLRELTLTLTLLMGCAIAAAAQSREQIEYWRTAYQELKPNDNPRAATAHTIFQKIVQVAGKRAGVQLRLFIVVSDPWDIALPIALPNGWIILSKGALDICYQDPKRGEDRLAFILAHEVAHQLKDDFWHIRFFQALEATKARSPVSQELLEEMRRTASSPEQVLARELQADEQGIIYASMAGFNPHAIVTADNSVNFFADWLRTLDPRRVSGIAVGQLRPTPQERAEALRAHLRRVVDKTAIFQAGLWFYYAGDYVQAIHAFEHFRAFFPSREVSHNLAVSHHQLALQAYQTWKKDTPVFPFQLSLAIDPLTRASRIALEGPKRGGPAASTDPTRLFRQHLDEAIVLYGEALKYDAAYTPAALNLGCAFLVRGLHTATPGLTADFSEARTTFLRAIEQDQRQNSPEMLNNLGVALFYDEKPRQAKEQLAHARQLAPTYAAPIFNLGYIAHVEQQEADAQRYWRDYQALIPQATPASPASEQAPEHVMGLSVGRVIDHKLTPWETSIHSTFYSFALFADLKTV
jgi:tetratricopeptide (TPR) repeat protein